MKRVTKPYLFFFLILYLLFTWRYIVYWNDSMTLKTINRTSAIMMTVATFTLMSYCLLLYWERIRKNIKGIHVLCVLWIVVITLFSFMNNTAIQITYSILWPLVFEAGFVLYDFNKTTEKYFIRTFAIIAIYGAYLFVLSQGLTDKQTNVVYFCFLTLPWLLLIRGRKWRILLIIIFSGLVFFSMKRSVLISVVLIWGFFVLEMIRGRRNKLSAVILSLMLIGCVSYIFLSVNNQLGGKLEERINREETDEGRNRLAIWTVTMEMIKTSPIDKLILGHGRWGVQKDSPLEVSAHNDPLEVVYDYGIIVFVLYLILWAYTIQTCYRLYKSKSEYFLPYVASLSIFLPMSLVSHLILYASYFNNLVLLWGYVEGRLQLEQRKKF